jgi:predicted short-subunit dehydrogenase-like oxidoreductase (DUF2520 family)
MKIGIVGAGRVGFSIGKYLSERQSDMSVIGYYDTIRNNAVEAAQFTGTESFQDLERLVELSDTLFITTPDGIIAQAWDCIKEMSLTNKIICHFSGSLSSVVFSGMEETGASGCSIHPMLAFSDKYSSYQQLEKAFFTIEGDAKAVEVMSHHLKSLGNTVCPINGDKKALYHTAASILSNQVVAVLDTGYRLLAECGFSRDDAIKASEHLVRGNVENVIRQDTVQALTGPIDRGDVSTVQKHLAALNGEDKEMYCILGKKLVEIAQVKNPDRDYSEMLRLLSTAKKSV